MSLKKALIIPDCHIPFHDERAYKLMLDVAYEEDVDEVVILGDYADFYAVNSHGKRPGLSDFLEYEITEVKNELAYLRGMFPKSKITYIVGNHEHRLERYIQNKAPELFGMIKLSELLGTRELNIELIPYGPNQQYNVLGSKLLARHEPISGGVHVAHGTVVKAGKTVIFGHVHRIQESQIVTIDGENHRGITCGWLGDVNNEIMGYVKNHHQWALGFALVYVQDNGNFYVDTKHIIDYNVLHNSEVMKG